MRKIVLLCICALLLTLFACMAKGFTSTIDLSKGDVPVTRTAIVQTVYAEAHRTTIPSAPVSTQTQKPTNTPTLVPTVIFTFQYSDTLLANCDTNNHREDLLGKEVLKAVNHLPIDVITPPPPITDLEGLFSGSHENAEYCLFVALPGRDSDTVTFWYGKENTIFWGFGKLGGGPDYYSNNGIWWWLMYIELTKMSESQTPILTP